MTSHQIMKLGDVAVVLRGSTITRKQVSPGKIPVIAGGQTPSCYHNASNREGETITVSASGAYAGFVQYFSQPIFASDCSTIKVKDTSKTSTKFLFYMLKALQKEIYSFQRGSGQPHVYPSQLVGLDIPIPPLPEQHKTVEVLEDHLSRLDAALADVCSASSKSSKLKLAILGKVFSGDFFEFDMPIMRVEEVARVMNGDRGKNYPNKSARVQSGVAFINAGHLDNDVLNVEEMDFISEERFNLLAAGKVEQNDLLFCLRGSLGKVAINDKFSKGAIASSLAILRVNSKVLSKYLYYYFMSPLAAVEIRKYDNGTAQPNLSAANLKKFEVPVPSIEQQNKIVDFLDSELSLTIQTKQTLDSVFLTASTLRRSLLQAAFTGQLSKEVASV